MSRKWSSGFESNSIVANVEWDVFTGAGATVQATTVRTGGFAFKAAPTATTALIRKQFQADTVTDNYVRFYFRIHTAPAATIPIFQYTDSANGVGTSVRITSGRLLQLFDDNGTGLQVGSSSGALTVDTWYRIEVRIQDGASGATFVKELKLDGTVVATTSTGQAIAGAGKIVLGAISSATCEFYFDDVAVNINDAEGKGQDGYPGAGSIVHMHPDSAGDNAQWAAGAGGTANWNRVSEVTPDDATTYNKRINTGTLIDDFNMGTSLSAGIGASDAITLVQVGGRPGALLATASTRDIKYRIKSQAAGTVLSSGVVDISQNAFMTHVDGPPYIYQLTSFVDPQAAGAWTPALLDTAQIGYVNNTSSVNEIRMSTLWLLVEFVPHAGGTNYTSSLGGTFSASGTLNRRTNRLLAGIYSDQGTLLQKLLIRLLPAASFSASGNLNRKTLRSLTATFSASGAFSKTHLIFQALTGMFSASGNFSKSTKRNLAANYSDSGQLNRSTSRLLPASFSSSGSLNRRLSRLLGATYSDSGVLATAHVRLVSFAATFTASGSLNRVVRRVLTATFSSNGALNRRLSRALAATFSSSGIFSKRTSLPLSGSYSDSGTLSQGKRRALSATYSDSGQLNRSLSRKLTASFSSSGSLLKRLFRAFAGLYSDAGTLTTHKITIILVNFSATFSASGNLNKRLSRSFGGVFSASGFLSIFKAAVYTVIKGFISTGTKDSSLQSGSKLSQLGTGGKISDINTGNKDENIGTGSKSSTIDSGSTKAGL